MDTLQRTLAIVKPDAVAKGAAGDIIATIEQNGFRVIGLKMLHLKKAQASAFYAVHVGKPFFDSLSAFMTSARSSCWPWKRPTPSPTGAS